MRNNIYQLERLARVNPEAADRGDSIKILIIVEQGHPILDRCLGDEAIGRLSYGGPLFSARAIKAGGADVCIRDG